MRKILILLLILIPYYSLQAQNTTNSPTSMFGIGELSYGEGGQYAGMGGAGIGLRSGTFINYANPAAISALDSTHFIVDMGVKGAYRIYHQIGNNHSFVGNLNNLSIGFRMKPYLYAGVFITPVSSCDYAVTLDQDVIGSQGSTISSLYEGDGGLSKMGLTGAVLLMKKLSIGASISYVSGTITQTETQSTASAEITSRKQGFYADFGAQYLFNINKHRSIIIGAVYGLSQPLHQSNKLVVSSSSGGTGIDERQTYTQQYLPAYYGIGATYLKDRWLFTADYRFYDWSKMKSSISYVKYQNQNNIMVGTEYTMGNIYRYPVKMMMGAGLSNSYVVISGKKAENYYVSGGLNFLLRNNNTLSFGVKYNDQFNIDTNMQRDKGLTIFLNISFNERIWRGKIQ